MRGGMRWMYRGVDGSITEEDWAGQTHQLHFLLPRRRFFCITVVPPCRRERPRGRSILVSCTAQKHCPCTPD